jgi:predicted small secreted protein
MKTKKSLLVVPAIVLVFALVFTTCSNGSTGGGGKDTGSTQGQLAFERITDGKNAGTWRVRKGTVTSGKVVIPAYYNGSTGRAARSVEDGDPVTEIGWERDPVGGGAFSEADITEVIIPETVKSIGP